MNLGEDPFVKFMGLRRGARVYLKPYWGNSGDELIWRGHDVLFGEQGLERVWNPKKADIVMIPGGNATMWDSPLSEWRDCWDRWPQAEFVIAPSGFRGGILPWQKMLSGSRARITGLFARDRDSHQNLLKVPLASSVTVGLAHDPAIHLHRAPWIADLREGCTAEYVLACFRGDHESNFGPPQRNSKFKGWPLFGRFQNYQSMKFHQERLAMIRRMNASSLPIREQDVSLASFQTFVECIARAGQVHTDRLHVMILGVLLGKEVLAYQTSYGKLEGVYEQSIKSWARVEFVKL